MRRFTLRDFVRRVSAPWVLVVCGFTAAQADGNGADAAAFLTLPSGARASALGGASVAAADDATALHWNPAGLTRISKRSVVFTHAAEASGAVFDELLAGVRRPKGWAWGLGVRRFSVGRLDRLDEFGAPSGGFTPADTAVSLALARKRAGWLWGASVKYVRSTVLDTADTTTWDAGVSRLKLWDGRLDVGAALANLGGRLSYGGPSESLPQALRAGGVYRVNGRLSALLDVTAPQRERSFVSGGAEYELPTEGLSHWAFRAGYNTAAAGAGSTASFSAGFGLSRKGLRVDYAFAPAGDLGNAHRLSLGCDF